jgi:hypothetical protein
MMCHHEEQMMFRQARLLGRFDCKGEQKLEICVPIAACRRKTKPTQVEPYSQEGSDSESASDGEFEG